MTQPKDLYRGFRTSHPRSGLRDESFNNILAAPGQPAPSSNDESSVTSLSGKKKEISKFFFRKCGMAQHFQRIMFLVPHSVKSSLLIAFRYLLKPLVRMAVQNGVAFTEFSGALKRAYIDVAVRQLKTAGTQVAVEGIHVITGIETREIDRMLRAEAGTESTDLDAQAQSPLPLILSTWHTDARYTGPYGVLIDLEFTRSSTSGRRSFSDLAAECCPGVSPRALLDELIRTGCVQDVGSGFYRAITRAYVPDPLSDESILLVAQVVHNLCETLQLNLRRDPSIDHGLLQRTIYTRTGLTPEAMKRFDSYLRTRGLLFAEEIDDWLSKNHEREGTQGAVKTGIGIYHYVVNDEDEMELVENLPLEGDGK
jgi:hypothetical protein